MFDINNLKNWLPTIKHTESNNFFLFAGPCVIENEKLNMSVAEELCKLTEKYKIPFVFKSSYRKANRSKSDSFTGIGDKEAFKILQKMRTEFKIPVVTDIHESQEAQIAAEFVDV